MEILHRERLIELLDRARSLRVGVIGDFTLDGYWFADMTRSRLSREAPLFPKPVIQETYNLGGAANVAWNLANARIARVYAFTVLGMDWRAELLKRLLVEARIRLDDILISKYWLTPFFGKVILTAHDLQQEDARLDFVNSQPLTPDIEAALLARLQARLPGLDALVIADYQPVGIFTPQLRAALVRLAGKNPSKIFLADSREQIGDFASMIIKPNESEAASLFFPERETGTLTPQELSQAALQFQVQYKKPVFITLSERGVICVVNGISGHIPAIKVPPPIDPVGAGDTFLAWLSIGLAAGASPWEAARLATLATAVTIRQIRVTGAASPEQILEMYDAIPDDCQWE